MLVGEPSINFTSANEQNTRRTDLYHPYGTNEQNAHIVDSNFVPCIQYISISCPIEQQFLLCRSTIGSVRYCMGSHKAMHNMRTRSFSIDANDNKSDAAGNGARSVVSSANRARRRRK